MSDIGLKFYGDDLLPFLNNWVILPSFQSLATWHSESDCENSYASAVLIISFVFFYYFPADVISSICRWKFRLLLMLSIPFAEMTVGNIGSVM